MIRDVSLIDGPLSLPALKTLIVALSVLALTSAAAAQERVAGELRLGGGYDSNPSVAADPGSRRQPGRRPFSAPVPTGDGVARLRGWVAGRLGDSPRASARLDVDGRIYGGGELLFWERLTIEGAFRIDDVLPRCRLEGSRLDVTASDDSAFGAGLACGAIIGLPLGFWVAAEVEGGVRAFDVGQLDGLGGGALSAGWSWEPVAIELGLSVMRRESDRSQARRTDVAPWLGVRVTTRYVGGTAAYRYVARQFEADSRSGGEHVAHVEVWGMPLEWLGVYAALDYGYAEGGPQALAYERVQITGGVRMALEWRSEPEVQTSREATVADDGSVRFAFSLPDAERVSVVGDFNGWDETRGRLERRADGRFEGRFVLEPGHHEYHLIVDGEPMRPPGAVRYVRDDFGGENAVIVVEPTE